MSLKNILVTEGLLIKGSTENPLHHQTRRLYDTLRGIGIKPRNQDWRSGEFELLNHTVLLDSDQRVMIFEKGAPDPIWSGNLGKVSLEGLSSKLRRLYPDME